MASKQVAKKTAAGRHAVKAEAARTRVILDKSLRRTTPPAVVKLAQKAR